MEYAAFLIDFILHVDRHLSEFVQAYGGWVYALLFAIIFVETGLVVMPFLPGDSLLFVVGALCGLGLMSLPLSMLLLTAAAVLGNQTNYTIGRLLGPRVFGWEQSRWFNKRAFEQAHAFYEKYGGITIVAARFMPFVRTFAPFVAGVAEMTRRKFTLYDVSGAVLTQTSTQRDADGWGCQHALTSAANLVVEAWACSDSIGGEAHSIVDEMLKNAAKK